MSLTQYGFSEYSSRRIYLSTSTSPQSAPSVTSNCAESDVNLTKSLWQHQFTHLSRLASTIATACWMVRQKRWRTSCNWSYAARIIAWPRFDARSTRYCTLFGCTRTRHIQAVHDRLQVSAQNGTDISVGDVPAELVGGWSSSFAFC